MTDSPGNTLNNLQRGANSHHKTTYSDAKPLRSNGSRRCRPPLARRPVIRCFSLRNPKSEIRNGFAPVPRRRAGLWYLAFLIRHWLCKPAFPTAPAPLRSRLGTGRCRLPLSFGIRHLSFGIGWASHRPATAPAPLRVAAKRAVGRLPLPRFRPFSAFSLCPLRTLRSRPLSSGRFVRTLTKFSPLPDFVRTLTTFRPLRGRRSGLPCWHGDLRQFCPLKNPSKTEQNRTKTEQNGHQNRKNGPKNSAFCLTYLNIRPPNRPSRARIKDRSQKKRAFARFGEVKIDVSVMHPDACVANQPAWEAAGATFAFPPPSPNGRAPPGLPRPPPSPDRT